MPRTPTMPAAETTPVAILLDRVTRELEHVADRVLALQTTIGTLVADASGTGAKTIRDLQALDLIEQTLRDLAAVGSRAGVTLVGAASIDLRAVTAVCRLAALAERLCGEVNEPVAADGLDLF